MAVFLLIVSLVLSAIFIVSYFRGQNKFSPDKLFFALWFLAIAISQLRLSPNEQPWSLKFWLLLIIFFLLFGLIFKFFFKKFHQKLPLILPDFKENFSRYFVIFLGFLTLAAVAVNAYILWKFGTLPILSSRPDSFRFVINRKVFGLWEYIALLPRLVIPFSFYYLMAQKTRGWVKWLLIANIIVGLVILSAYVSRLVLIFPILLCYFSYLMFNLKSFNFKKFLGASLVAVALVLILSTTIPAFRQSISYHDYVDPNAQSDPFAYIVALSGLHFPPALNFLAPLYIIPTFNLQALMRAVDFYHLNNFYWGKYSLTALAPFFKLTNLTDWLVKIPFTDIFLSWWVTATYLFSWWADFGYFGLALAALFLGLILALAYAWAIKKPQFLSIMIFAYLSFAVIMTIYTNYFQRSEVYLDLVLIFIAALILRKKKTAN